MAANEKPTIGLVLAGGGARGAYEAGALSILLPALEEQGETPRVLVGTSIGALNVGVIAGLAHRPAAEVADGLLARWRDLRTADGLVPLHSLGSLRRLLRLGGQAFGLTPPASLLDLSPYAGTIAELVDFERVHANVASREVASVAVATTSYTSGECVVFHESQAGANPPFDERRLIRYAPTSLATEHIRASGSMQVLARATEVTDPPGHAGWYGDGAARLNTPIKPALRLGADKVAVIGLDPIAAPTEVTGETAAEPHVFDAANQLMHGLLADELAHDVATLASRNAASPDSEQEVPYCFVVPQHRDRLGEIAQRVYSEHLTGPVAALRNRDLVTVGRMLGAGQSAAQGSLFSMLFIHPRFAEALIEEGRGDAEAWLADHPGVWTR